MEAKVRNEINGSSSQRQQASERATSNNDSEHELIKECPYTRYGCLGCLMSQPAGHCLCGNEFGDEYCQRDRKLNTRATALCLQKGCLSAVYVENHTLVCTHSEKECRHIDSHGNSYGQLVKTRSIAEIIDADVANKSLQLVAVLKSRRHPSGAIITEVPVS